MEFKTFSNGKLEKWDIVSNNLTGDLKVIDKLKYESRSRFVVVQSLEDESFCTKEVHEIFKFKNFENYWILSPNELIIRNQERIDNLLN